MCQDFHLSYKVEFASTIRSIIEREGNGTQQELLFLIKFSTQKSITRDNSKLTPPLAVVPLPITELVLALL
jgi:hypothetical protein